MEPSVTELEEKGKAAKAASRKLAFLGTEIKNKALLTIAEALIDKRDEILAANNNDYEQAKAEGMNEAMLDRLMLSPSRLKGMAKDAIIFACANPIPEIWPWEAKDAGARIVGTGRSDFPNQVNNSLVFPAIFRGVLDVQATTITDEMAIAAAQEIALFAERRGIHEENIITQFEARTEEEAIERLTDLLG